MEPFEIIDHTADVGLRAYGGTLKEAFENAAAGMFSLIVDPEDIKQKASISLSVSAEDREALLVEWLNELLYRFEVDYMVFSRFEITDWDEENRLTAKAYGEPLDLGRHKIKIQIKACTYHMLKVAKNTQWVAQVIFDT